MDQTIPFGVKIKNTSSLPKKAIIFGSDRNFHKLNYGNDRFIEIENLGGDKDTDYGQLLAQLRSDPIRVGLIRMNTDNVLNYTKSGKTLTLLSTDAIGSASGTKIDLNDLDKRLNDRFQECILEFALPFLLSEDSVIYDIRIDTRLQFEIDLEPNSEMTFIIFPLHNQK